MDRIADIAAGIITLAIIATVVASKNTASQVTALGNSFINSIKAAKGA